MSNHNYCNISVLILLAVACISITDIKAQTLYDYPTRAVPVQLNAQIFSALTWEQARRGVPEIKLISKKEEEIEYIGNKKNLIDLGLWQESPSRIIYHEGKYHTWIMHIEWYADLYYADTTYDYSSFKNYHLTSEDGYRWNVEEEMPTGEPGSFDDKRREGLQVVKWDGKFWMFYAGVSKESSRYRSAFTGIGLLVADQPEGPWKKAAEGPVFEMTDNPAAWDNDMLNNPYPVYFKGKWYLYYKSRNAELTGKTLQGVAISDSITGPYIRYENNPVCDGHGSFAWAYRGGITMLAFGTGGKIHLSPDGTHFINVDDPASRGIKTPRFSAFYLPHDPLSGDPVSDHEPNEFWGLETRRQTGTNPRNWNILRGTVIFNPVEKDERK